MKQLLTIIITLAVCLGVWAQNDSVPYAGVRAEQDSILTLPPSLPQGLKSTPVDIDDNKPRTVLHYYDKHGEPLDEPVMFLAALDTVQKVKSRPIYPTYNGLNVGLDFGDLIFMAFGQRYGSFGLWANVSLWNWIFPTLECGLGYADATPDKQNFTYKVDPAFYAKIGLNYNFLYKSNPDYQVFLGLRTGFTQFSYALRNVTIESDFWNETRHISIEGLRATCWYGEALAGVQVKIVGGFSLGWSARWHFKFNNPKDRGNKPWFVPGYGGSFPLSLSVSAIWTIPGPSKPDGNTAGKTM